MRWATPTCCRISIERRVKTMARLPCDTCSSLSSTTLGTPWRASSSAVTMPAGPEPAITTRWRAWGGWAEGSQGANTW